LISENKGKGRGLLCNACKADFDAGRMVKWRFDERGKPYSVPVTVYESMECQCNCYAILDDKVLEDIEAWPANHPDLAWAYKTKPSTKSTVDVKRDYAVKASMVKGVRVAAKATDTELLTICDAMHREFFVLPQVLQSMEDPSTLINQEKIRWGYRMRGVADGDIEGVYLRGLADGWFRNVPEHAPMLAPVLGRCCCQPGAHTLADSEAANASICRSCGQAPPEIDWHHARLGLIFLMLYGQRITYVRHAGHSDPRKAYRLLTDPYMSLMDVTHGDGRIGMRLASEGRDGVLQFKPYYESSNTETEKRLENMQYYLEAIAFKRMPGLQFSAITGEPIWTLENEKFRLIDTSCKAQFADHKAAKRLKQLKMKFSKVDELLLSTEDGGTPHIVGYLRVGFADIISKTDFDTVDYAPRRWLQQAIEVAMAWNALQREVRLPTNFRPISVAEETRLRGFVLRFIQLYIEHQGATRLSNYLCLWMTMVATTQMTKFPLLALCNQCSERKVGKNRPYTINATNHGGNCDSTHYNTEVVGIKRPRKVYGLGLSMRDYFLGQFSLCVGNLYYNSSTEGNQFLHEKVKAGVELSNKERKRRYALITMDPVKKAARSKERKEYRKEAKANKIKRLARMVDRRGNPEQLFTLAAPEKHVDDTASRRRRKQTVFVRAPAILPAPLLIEDVAVLHWQYEEYAVI